MSLVVSLLAMDVVHWGVLPWSLGLLSATTLATGGLAFLHVLDGEAPASDVGEKWG